MTKHTATVVPLHDQQATAAKPKRTLALWYPHELREWRLFTAGMTHEQRSVARCLRDWYWLNQGPIPDDDRILAQAAEVSMRAWTHRLREPMAKRFRVEVGHWHDGYLDGELAKYRDVCERNRKNRQGGDKS